MRKCLNLEDEALGHRHLLCNVIASIQTQMCPETEKGLNITNDQNNMDFVGPSLGPLSQII